MKDRRLTTSSPENSVPVKFSSNRSVLLSIVATFSVVGLALPEIAPAQQTSLPDAPGSHTSEGRPTTVRGVPLDILRDELHIVTSPARIRKRDLGYLLPITGAAIAGLLTDEHTMTQVVSQNPSFNTANVNTSNALVGSMMAAPVLLFGVGEFARKPYARDSGIIASEAMADGWLTIEASKLIFLRERPYVDNGRGKFFQLDAGAGSSFASGHSVVAWSAAAALADRYPKVWVQASVYTIATGVSLTRVLGQQHFPTDVLVGGAAGWLIGHYVSRSHRRHQRP